MKYKKTFIFIIVLSILNISFYFIYLSIIEKNSTYMIIGNNTIWRYSNEIWTDSNVNKVKRLSFEKSFIYNGYDNSINGGYFNYSKEGLEIFDKNYEPLDMNNNVLSIIGPKKISVINLEMQDTINEYDQVYVDEVLDKYSINNPGNNITTYKNVLDMNNDGNDDYLYSISNFYSEEEKDLAFSIVFCIIDEEIKIIDKVVVDADKELSEKSLYLTNVIDEDLDNTYEVIIFKTSYGNVKDDCHAMYKYINGKYEKVIGC